MATGKKLSKPLSKANSPVKITGQKAADKKRLLVASPEEARNSREKILLAARACFAKNGFAGTSINDIQEAAQCSRGNLYHYFKTKEEMIQIIITQNLGLFCAQTETILQELGDQDLSLAQIIQKLAGFAEEITKGPGRGMAFHVWSLAMVDPEIRAKMVACFEQIRDALERKVKVLIAQKKITKTNDTQQLSVALFGLVIPAFTLQSVYMDAKSINSKQYVKALAELFKNAE